MGNKGGKSQREYEEEISRLVVAGKRLMAEADEIISAQTGMRKENKPSRHHKRNEENQPAPRISQEQQTEAEAPHLGFWGNICAMFLGYKFGEMLFGDDKPQGGKASRESSFGERAE